MAALAAVVVAVPVYLVATGVGETMLPLAGSPLLDFIPPSAWRTGAAANVTDDERGVTRPQGPGCEIGAAEVEVVTPPVAIQPNFTG